MAALAYSEIKKDWRVISLRLAAEMEDKLWLGK
jgi:hypothetical protein